MKSWRRTAGKWALRGILLLVLLAALDVTALAFPYPLFENKFEADKLTIYSNVPLPDDVEEIAEGVQARVDAMECPQLDAGYRVFICGGERLYSFFAFLSRKSPNSMGIGLSLLGNMYLNGPRIDRIAASDHGGMRHSRFEGDLAFVIAHEIAHSNVIEELGLRTALGLPDWKSEGYADYQAALAGTRADRSYALADRIRFLLDDSFWGGGRSIARRLYEWHLLVEFLAEEKGFDLNDLIDETVTEAFARQEMLAWYEDQREGR
jgi:hypothetical protein